jgi:hypothetical protein
MYRAARHLNNVDVSGTTPKPDSDASCCFFTPDIDTRFDLNVLKSNTQLSRCQANQRTAYKVVVKVASSATSTAASNHTVLGIISNLLAYLQQLCFNAPRLTKTLGLRIRRSTVQALAAAQT